MKVVHICTSLDGGAGLCASRIIRSTRALGVDAKVLVAQGEKAENIDVVEPAIPWSRIWPIKKIQALLKIKGMWPKPTRIQKRIEEEKRKNQTPVAFTSPITLYRNIAEHPWVQEADLIHLHWIGDFVDYESFFSNNKKPIVWTIHDLNPGFGGFHFKYHTIESFKAFDDELALLKEQAYRKARSMTLIAISTMMMDFFHKNPLLHNFPSTMIYNGLEENRFTPIPVACSREALDLPTGNMVFLFVTQNIHDERKGLKELIAALEELNNPSILLVCLGSYRNVPAASFEIRCEGYVCNNRLQSLYYSAADYFVMPSFQEGFAQVPMEAMACGTPVIAFPCSGSQDLINQENGVVCDDFTVEALVNGIKLAVSRNYDRKRIRENLVNRFSYHKIARQYKELYEKILKTP